MPSSFDYRTVLNLLLPLRNLILIINLDNTFHDFFFGFYKRPLFCLCQELPTKIKLNFSLRCQLDDVPVQTELIQYVVSLFHFTFPLHMFNINFCTNMHNEFVEGEKVVMVRLLFHGEVRPRV